MRTPEEFIHALFLTMERVMDRFCGPPQRFEAANDN